VEVESRLDRGVLLAVGFVGVVGHQVEARLFIRVCLFWDGGGDW